MKKKTFKSAIQREEIDEQTGEITRQTLLTEVVEGYVDLKLPQKHKFNNGDFITLFQSSLITIAKNYKKAFTRDEGAVFLYLLGTCGIANSINIDYEELVEELGIHRTHAVTAIKSLQRKNIIILHKERGRRNRNEGIEMNIRVNFDQINYNLAYNGKTKDFSKVKFDHPQIEIGNKPSNQIDIFQAIAEQKRLKGED